MTKDKHPDVVCAPSDDPAEYSGLTKREHIAAIIGSDGVTLDLDDIFRIVGMVPLSEMSVEEHGQPNPLDLARLMITADARFRAIISTTRADALLDALGENAVKSEPAAPSASVDFLRDQIDILVDALSFYANGDNWASRSTGFAAQYDPETPPVIADRGLIAKRALMKTIQRKGFSNG